MKADVFTFSNSTITIYSVWLGNKRLKNKTSIETLAEDNEPIPETIHFTGLMDGRTKRKITKILYVWTQSVIEYMKHKRIPKYQSWRYLTFVTLTLSAPQIHTDNEIKRELLNHFLIKAKRNYGLKNYLWVAEKQKNGNIHFHIVFDRPVAWQDIQEDWNAVQENLGYISRFYNTYLHITPNSTDIHSLQNIRNVSGYMIKYMTKGNTIKAKQEGRIWGCSRQLGELKYFGDMIDSTYFNVFNKLLSDEFTKKMEFEYCTLIDISKSRYLNEFREKMSNKMKDYYINTFNDLYN
jgi:hypothetical protein